MTINIKVKNMVCKGCENRIEKSLKSIEKIKKVKADHVSGLVTIKAEDDLDKDIVIKKILEEGFEIEN